MTWVRLDDAFPHHPKVTRAGDMASWLFVCGLCYAAQYLTDGRIPRAQVRRLTTLRRPEEFVAKLLEVGLWEEDGDDYVIHDWHVYNPSAAEVKARRNDDRIRKASARNPAGRTTESEQTPSGIQAPRARARAGVPSPTHPQDPPPTPSAANGAVPAPGEGDRSDQGDEALERVLEDELKAKVAKGETIANPQAWKDWRRPHLRAERTRRAQEAVQNARDHGERTAALVVVGEIDDDAALATLNCYEDPAEHQAAVEGFRRARARVGAA
jgi:hypothetical protein